MILVYAVTGFIILPCVLVHIGHYILSLLRVDCHACQIDILRPSGVRSSVILPHSCLIYRLRGSFTSIHVSRRRPVKNLPQVVERHAQVVSKQVGADERKPARLLRIVAEDTRDVRDRAVGGKR
jgi:hypothetical protein